MLRWLQPQSSCLTGVCQPQRTQGLLNNVEQGEFTLVQKEGTGVFLSAQISKQGGTNDITIIDLTIDGQNVVNISFAALENFGLTQSNSYGLVLLQGDNIKTATIGYPVPLRFNEELRLSVNVQEPEIVQIVSNVISGGLS